METDIKKVGIERNKERLVRVRTFNCKMNKSEDVI